MFKLANLRDSKKAEYWFFLLGVLICFSLVFLTVPLYHSNQNTKFLHGMAQAGFGDLANDWTANTADGLAAFSYLVYLTAKYLPIWFFYVEQFALYAVFIVAVFGIHLNFSENEKDGKSSLLWFAVLFIVMNAQQGLITQWHGVAMQFMFNKDIQTSNFGVFILLSFLFAAKDKKWTAAILANVGALFHPGYIIPTVMIFIAFILSEGKPSLIRVKSNIAYIIGGLLLVANALWLKSLFPETTPEMASEATAYLANKRIPWHTDPSRWMNVSALGKLLTCVGGAYLARHSKLGRMLAIATGLAVLSSLIAFLPGTDFWRLATPWRVSVILVPVGMTIVLSWLAIKLGNLVANYQSIYRYRVHFSCVLIAVLLGFGIAYKIKAYSVEDLKVYDFVRENRAPGEQYLTSVRDYRFRLSTGAAQFINQKTHPYKDNEVLEWKRRVDVTKKFYASQISCSSIDAISASEGISNILFSGDRKLPDCQNTKTVYKDQLYKVVKIIR